MSLQPPTSLLALPPELLGCVFQQFHPAGSVDFFVFTPHSLASCCQSSITADRTALARCARVCRALHGHAVAVLWREVMLDHVCWATLFDCTFGSVKWPPGDAWGEELEDGEDDEMNLDAAVGYSTDSYDYRYTYDYIPGPISTADWARFQHYARYVHVLCYPGTNTIDPLVFTYLTQRAGSAPIFPNLREIIWLHATPELAIMTSPSLRVLRIPEAGTEELNGCRLHEYGFRARRHALKTLTPVILGSVPGLEVLELRLMGHESFWEPLGAAFSNRLQPLCRQLHTVHITESPRVLTRAALDALSRVEKLAELRIDVVGKNYLLLAEWTIPHITRTFASLKHLRLRGLIPAVAALVCAIDAPGLEDVELETWELDPDDWEELAYPPVEVLGAAFSVAFDSLRRRNAATVRRLSVIVQDFDAPLFLFPAMSDPSSSLPDSTQPLLELRCLQDLTLVHVRDNEYISPQSVVRAWPSLRTLSLPDFVLTPYALHSLARTCTMLNWLSAKHLSADFVEQLPLVGLSSADGAPALRQLNVYDAMPSMSTADARKVGSFLNSLFPQLEPETCSVLFGPTHKHPSVHVGGWPDVLREARMLQAVRQRN